MGGLADGLASPLGSDSPLQIDYVASWKNRLTALLYEQFKDQPNFLALVQNVIAPQFQDLEDSGQSLLTLPSIDLSEGVNLDVIGLYVGQPRAGVDDGTYRMYLKAKVLADRSTGGPEDLYAVMSALLGVPLIYTPGGLASFEMRALTVVSDAQATIATAMLQAARDGGVRGIFEWQEFDDTTTFMFANCTTLTVQASPGATTLTVDSRALSGFPATGGNLVIDRGLATQEAIAYTSITGGNTLHLSTAIAQTHAVNAEVDLDETGASGLGWGSSSDATQGGDWSGAANA